MTGPASLVSVSVRAAAAAAALLALGVALASCGDTEENVAPQPTATALPTGITSAPVTATPSPSAAPIPEDWQTYSIPEAGLTLRYPPTWFALKDGGIHSWDPATWNGPYIPAESVSIDVIYGSSEFAEQRPAGSTDVSTAAGSGWEITYQKIPAVEDGLTRVHQVALQRGEFTLFIIASFSQANPDEETFSRIVNSLRFAD